MLRKPPEKMRSMEVNGRLSWLTAVGILKEYGGLVLYDSLLISREAPSLE